MNYCPGCQEPLELEQEECPYCGYELIATKKEPEADSSVMAIPKKPFYKRAVFIAPLIILVVLGILGGAGFAGYQFYQAKQENESEKNLKALWLEITNRSDQIASSLDLVKQPSDLESFKQELSDFNDFLSEKQTEAVNLEVMEKYQNNQSSLVESIEKYSDYAYLLKLTLQKAPAEVKTDDYTKITHFSENAQAGSDKFVAEASFIEGSLPKSIFSAIDKIKPLIEKIKTEEAAKEQETLKQQQAADKREAEKTVSSFMQARIDRNGAEMRRYITPGYDKVFDPEQEFAVTDTYAIDFRITKTESKEAGAFEVNGDESGKDLTGAKYVNKWWFKVIKLEGAWLIDNRKLLEE